MNPVSLAIMAHPSRQAWVEALQAQVGPVPVAWAEPPWATGTDRGPCWRTKRAALLLHTDASFHCVIQDDALLSSDFVGRVNDLVKHGDFVYSLFYRHKASWPDAISKSQRAHKRGADHFTLNGNVLGVAVIVPTARISDLIEFCDKQPSHLGDDDRMKAWARSRGIESLFPLPSLVDHRVGESLVGHPPRRVAWRFAG